MVKFAFIKLAITLSYKMSHHYEILIKDNNKNQHARNLNLPFFDKLTTCEDLMVNLSGIVGLSGGTGDTFPTQVFIYI